MKIEFYNAESDGTAKTILAGCYKFGHATLLRTGGGRESRRYLFMMILTDKWQKTITLWVR